MDFVEGGQVNDRQYMTEHGIDVNEVREPCISRANPINPHVPLLVSEEKTKYYL